MSTAANALNISSAGIVKFDGTATFSADTVTQYNTLVGGASNAITSVAPSATSGVPLVSGGASANPSFTTAVVAGGGTGAVTLTGVLTGNGTSAVTANAVTQHGVVIAGASNAVASVGPGATGTVLIGTTSSDPSFTGYPQISGLGIGASPGSTAGITFDGTNFLNTYTTGTWSPGLAGSSTAGTPTYNFQNGNYFKIGALVIVNFVMSASNLSGAVGNTLITGLPFTQANNNGAAMGAVMCQASNISYAAGNTFTALLGVVNTTNAQIVQCGTGKSLSNLAVTNGAQAWQGTLVYQATS